MSARLDPILERIDELSIEELWTLQERVINWLRTKTNGNGQVKKSEPTLAADHIKIPGAYRLTKQQAEAGLTYIFSPEELAQMETVDLEELKNRLLSKSLTEIISEDREDRV
jgi:hypothetical protein